MALPVAGPVGSTVPAPPAPSTPVARGPLRVVTNQQMVDSERQNAAAAAQLSVDPIALDNLVGYIRSSWETAKNHRNNAGSGWSERLLKAMRVFNGQYDPIKLAQIQQFGGSDVYARIISVKCRGATSLLRDVYLGHERPYAMVPTPKPDMPDDVSASISQMVQAEIAKMAAAGQPPQQGDIDARVKLLREAANMAAIREARSAAQRAEDAVQDILVEGQFWHAFAEVLVDVPLFPFACIKGPVVRMVPDLQWVGGKPVLQNRAKMFWSRVSPFDIWWTPGISKIEDGAIFERERITRSDLNDLLDLPGYEEASIRAVLQEFGRGGVHDWMDGTDSERAVQENRENPNMNQSGMIDMLSFNGPVQGRMLLEHGFKAKDVPDPDRDYHVQAWVIGRHVIKVQFSPSPRKRHPYYITSFEKQPGTVIGNGLPDILEDVQDVANAALRAMVNNMGMASGPQVSVNIDRMAPGSDPHSMFPWKRWLVTNEDMPGTAQRPPVEFFQPASNAQELLQIYTFFTRQADEQSAIPQFLTGTGTQGGAGRTASGLAMLMGNASKILQTVAANIDRDIMEPLLQALYDMLMLTSTDDMLRGDEHIEVRGVAVAAQKETERQRQLEFLQTTANPIDQAIIGPMGRATVLRSVSKSLGLPGDEIVPSEDEMKAKITAMAQATAAQAVAGAPGQPGAPPDPAAQAQGGQQGKPPAVAGPSLNTVSPTPAPSPPLGGSPGGQM